MLVQGVSVNSIVKTRGFANVTFLKLSAGLKWPLKQLYLHKNRIKINAFLPFTYPVLSIESLSR